MLAETVMLGEMKAAGLLKGEVEDMMKVRIGAIFMPCGMGHLLGLDIHDVGGFPEVRVYGHALVNVDYVYMFADSLKEVVSTHICVVVLYIII